MRRSLRLTLASSPASRHARSGRDIRGGPGPRRPSLGRAPAGLGSLLRGRGRRRLPLARKRRRSRRAGMERRRERLGAFHPGRAAERRRDSRAGPGDRGVSDAVLRKARPQGRTPLRSQDPTAEAAVLPRDPRVRRRSPKRARGRRSERARSERRDLDRLVRSVRRREARRGLALRRRERDGHGPRLRDRNRTGAPRRHPAGQRRHRRGRRGLERRCFGLLLHPLSPGGRAARRRPRVLPAGVLPSSRHARRRATRTRWAGSFRGSPRPRSNPPTTAASCSRPSRTATAAKRRSISGGPTAPGSGSPPTRIGSSEDSSPPTARSFFSLTRARRAGPSCACPPARPICRRPSSSSPRATRPSTPTA